MVKPFVIEKDISLKEAANLMKKKDISSLIMLKKGKIVGIITQEDLVENFGENKMVSSVMSKKVLTLYEEDSTSRAIEFIKNEKISVVPITNKEGELVGVVDVKELLNLEESDDFLLN